MTDEEALAQALGHLYRTHKGMDDFAEFADEHAAAIIAALPVNPWADADRLAEALRLAVNEYPDEFYAEDLGRFREALRLHDEATK